MFFLLLIAITGYMGASRKSFLFTCLICLPFCALNVFMELNRSRYPFTPANAAEWEGYIAGAATIPFILGCISYGVGYLIFGTTQKSELESKKEDG